MASSRRAPSSCGRRWHSWGASSRCSRRRPETRAVPSRRRRRRWRCCAATARRSMRYAFSSRVPGRTGDWSFRRTLALHETATSSTRASVACSFGPTWWRLRRSNGSPCGTPPRAFGCVPASTCSPSHGVAAAGGGRGPGSSHRLTIARVVGLPQARHNRHRFVSAARRKRRSRPVGSRRYAAYPPVGEEATVGGMVARDREMLPSGRESGDPYPPRSLRLAKTRLGVENRETV